MEDNTMKQNHQNDAAIEAFRATYKDLDHTFSLFSKACGLSDAEYWALVMIRDGVCTQRDISEQLSMSKQTVNSAFRQPAEENQAGQRGCQRREKEISVNA